MDTTALSKEIVYIEDFGTDISSLFDRIILESDWDESMKSRKTVSYGLPYNYSGISYETTEIPAYLQPLIAVVRDRIGFTPNNCLINYYLEGDSKMGFHSDQTDILADDTGVAIFSLGDTRILRFKNKADKDSTVDITLRANSLFYMSQAVQEYWLHSIQPGNNARISLTFRKILQHSQGAAS